MLYHLHSIMLIIPRNVLPVLHHSLMCHTLSNISEYIPVLTPLYPNHPLLFILNLMSVICDVKSNFYKEKQKSDDNSQPEEMAIKAVSNMWRLIYLGDKPRGVYMMMPSCICPLFDPDIVFLDYLLLLEVSIIVAFCFWLTLARLFGHKLVC